MDKFLDVTKTAIPLGIASVSLITIISGVWYLATVNAQVKVNTNDIQKNSSIINTLPTRNEMDNLIKKVDEIGLDVKSLLKIK